MDQEAPQEPNKPSDAFSKLKATLINKPDKSGPWQIDCFACDELHEAASYGEQSEVDQACDSVFIADDAILKMINQGE